MYEQRERHARSHSHRGEADPEFAEQLGPDGREHVREIF